MKEDIKVLISKARVLADAAAKMPHATWAERVRWLETGLADAGRVLRELADALAEEHARALETERELDAERMRARAELRDTRARMQEIELERDEARADLAREHDIFADELDEAAAARERDELGLDLDTPIPFTYVSCDAVRLDSGGVFECDQPKGHPGPHEDFRARREWSDDEEPSRERGAS